VSRGWGRGEDGGLKKGERERVAGWEGGKREITGGRKGGGSVGEEG